MPDPENILLIRLKSIGDVVLTLPAVHAVRENFPGARLHYLVSAENASIVRGFADIDEIIPLNRAAFRSKNPFKIVSMAAGMVRQVRAKRFSRVIDFQGYGETGWLTRLSGAPDRWGRLHRPGRAWAYTRGFATDKALQLADWNLELLRQGGLRIGPVRNEFILPTAAVDEARKFFRDRGLSPEVPTLFLQPFTSVTWKNWPFENYLALAQHWRARGVQVIFAGGSGDRRSLVPAGAAGFAVAAGMPLLVAGGLMQLSTVVVGGVTGLVHLAVALQKRVIMLVGYPEDEPGFPYQHREWAVTAPAGCPASDIPLARVIEAGAEVLEPARRPQ